MFKATNSKIWSRPLDSEVSLEGFVNVPSGQSDLPSIKLYFKEFCKASSPNQPTLIYLHGGPGIVDHQIYTPFWSQFSDVARVIFFDMRGHGESGGREPHYSDTWTMSQWARDVYEFCKARQIEKPIVVGFSMGGWVAMDYLIQYPDHPAKVILCNTEAHVLVEERALAYKAKAIAKGLGVLQANEIAQIVRDLKIKSGDPVTSEKYVKYCMPLFSNNPYTKEELSWCTKPNAAVWERFDKKEYYSLDYRGKLHGIVRCPVLCIGGEDDPEHPPIGITEVAKEIGDWAVLRIFPGGDPIWRDCEQAVLKLVKEFIALPSYPSKVAYAISASKMLSD